MLCNLCERKCNVDRDKTKGICCSSNTLKVARASLHYFEEPCLSGNSGSGTIFFSGCNLKCVFCQNREISFGRKGKEITTSRLAEIMLSLQEKGALNINLVTPTHYINQIKESLIIAKNKGLKVPIVYNTSSYETVESLKLLDGLIDIYLPDLKYYNDLYAIKYSYVSNYFSKATEAISEMYRQVGKPTFNKDGIMKSGIIVRHLMLPNLEEDTKQILKYLYNTYHDNIYISIMNQYTPIKIFKSKKFDNLNKKIDESTYNDIINYAIDLGIKKAFIQEGETQSESFIPNFDNEGV